MEMLESFGIQPLLLAAQIVNFFILLFILKKFMYGPILKVLKERKEKIAQGLKNAEEIEAKLQKTEQEREEILKKATLEGRDIIEDATKSANEIIKEAHSKASADIEIIMEKGKQAIALEREKMQAEIRGELAGLIASAMEKVSEKSFSSKDHKDMIQKTIRDL